ncbi:13106_t:CDS:2, partial [Dentiscutata heterogama]
MTRRRSRPETPPHIRQDVRYKTPELEETPEDRRRRKSRKFNAAKNFYNALKNSNEITNNPIGDYDILADIQQDLHMHNPFVQVFRSAGQFVREGQPIMLRLLSGQGFDIRRYNRPTADEIAVLLIDNNADSENHHNPVSDALENEIDLTGGNSDEELSQPQQKSQRSHVTMRDYAAYRLHVRSPIDSILHHAGRLFHQYIVDQYAKIEQNRLLWQRMNQQTIRAELYQGLADALANDFQNLSNVCREDSTAANLLYSEFPKFFRWVKGAWIRRKRSGSKVIGRLYSCSPIDSERFCLRLLLCHIRGPTSFESLRTINGITYLTFKQAAQQLGLLESDEEWHNCLYEASLFRMPSQLRLLFATILIYCQPSDIKSLWDTYLPDLAEDFIYQARQRGENTVPEDPLIVSRALVEIEDHLRQCGKYLTDFPELPTIQHDLLNIDRQTQLFAEESSFSRDELQRILEGVSLLNDEQRAVYDAVIEKNILSKNIKLNLNFTHCLE